MKEYLLNFTFRVITSNFVYWQGVCQNVVLNRTEISYRQVLHRIPGLFSNRGQQTDRMTTDWNAGQEL